MQIVQDYYGDFFISIAGNGNACRLTNDAKQFIAYCHFFDMTDFTCCSMTKARGLPKCRIDEVGSNPGTTLSLVYKPEMAKEVFSRKDSP